MKKDVAKYAMTALIVCAACVSCKPSPEQILKKYDAHSPILTETGINKAGFSASSMSKWGAILIDFDNTELNSNEEYLRAMADRLYIADAEKPDQPLEVSIGISVNTVTYNNGEHSITNGLSAWMDEKLKVRYLIIGFEGIDESESETLNTPPLFYLIDRKTGQVLTPHPLLADQLFTPDYETMQFRAYQAVLTNHSSVDLSEKTYTVRIGNIGQDDEGYTYVDFLSPEIDEDDWSINHAWRYRIDPLDLYVNVSSPLFTTVKVGNETFLSKGYIIENGKGIREFYFTKELPDEITVWTKEQVDLVSFRLGEKAVFDGKTKTIINE